MKKSMIVIVLLAAATVQANLVYNGDFSKTADGGVTGFDGWTAYGSPMTLVEPTGAGGTGTTGTAWIRPLYWSVWTDVLSIQNGSSGGNGAGIMQTIDLTGVDGFDLSFKFGYNNSGSYATVTISYYDALGNSLGKYYQAKVDWTTPNAETGVDPNPTDAAYSNSSGGLLSYVQNGFVRGNTTELNSTFIPTSAASAQVRILAHYAGYQYYFDDITITAIPEPATLGLLGLGALGLLRRRKA